MIASLSKYFMNIPEDEKVLNHSIICRCDNEVIFPKFMENTSRIDYRTLFETIFDNESENAYHIDFLSDKWDFYPLKLRKSKCGWGYLKDGNMAIMPKMWRKEDFQRLLDHIDAHPELFSGLRIRQI